MRIGIVAHRLSETNVGLAGAAPPGFRAFVLYPDSAIRHLQPGAAALGRLDVLDTVDGIELRTLASRRWFRRTGAVAQELVPPLGHDLRVLVAGGEVVGAVKRIAPPGEWRTNVALGATRVPTEPPPKACELALAAAAALGADLVGVDLLPLGSGGFVVLEVNGAVDFGEIYAPSGDVFGSAMRALTRRLLELEPSPLTAVA